MDEAFRLFVRENFRAARVRGAARIRMGRRTYDWLARQERKDHLDHLTVEKLETLAARHALKKVVFDDGNTYVVKPDEEREILVEFFRRKDLLEPRMIHTRIRGDEPAAEDDVAEQYLISQDALALLAGGDGTPGPERTDTVDFLENLQIEKALDDGRLRLAYEESRVLVVAADEDPEDSLMYPLLLKSPLEGTEVSIETLDLGRRTIVSGAYRDTVGEGSHDVEHLVTKSED